MSYYDDFEALMQGEARRCYDCAHCYAEWYVHWSPPFEHFSVSGACDRINPTKMHVASAIGLTDHCCTHYVQRAYPIRIHPERTKAMITKGQWWTDIEPMQKMQQLESEKIPEPAHQAQRTLDLF